MSLLNEPHHIHTHIRTTLGGLNSAGKASLLPNIHIDHIRYALARVGAGLDHTIGEQALIYDEGYTKPRESKTATYLLVTDRRLVGFIGHHHDSTCDLRFRDLDQYRLDKGMLMDDLLVRAGADQYKITVDTYVKALPAFFAPLVGVPREGREPPPRPLCVPSEQDPTGALQAIGWMALPDARNEFLLRYIHQAHAQEKMPANVATDLVARIALHHRNEHFGRGSHQGRFLSPLSANDLSNCMIRMFGNPLGHQEQPVRTLTFPTNMKSNVGAAAVSTAVGLASAAILGIGWTQRARPVLSQFTFRVVDTGSMTSFRLQEAGRYGLHIKAPNFTENILFSLLNPEDAVLLRRAVYGWSEKSDALLAKDPNEIVDRLRAVVGDFDVNVLYKRAGQG